MFATVVLLLAGTGSGSAAPAPQEPDPDILVLAASSLVEVLPRAVASWESRHRSAVRFSFDATSRLAPQLQRGVPADLFLAADRAWLDWAASRGLVDPGTVTPVARNELVLIRGPGGAPGPVAPGDVAGWDRLERLALAGENVPAGRYARTALEEAGAWALLEERIVRGGSVRGTLEWVARDEVDYGIVYRSDALAEPRATIVFSFPPVPGSRVEYFGAVVASSSAPDRAAGLLRHLVEDSGSRSELVRAGFSPVGSVGPVGPVGPTESGGSRGPMGSQESGNRQVAASPVDPGAAVRLSLLVALATTVVGFLPALFIGWLLARKEFPGRTLVSTIVLAPLVLPPVVTGFVLLGLLGRNTLLGSALASVGLDVPFTLVGAVVAALVVGMPLYVIAVRGAFEAVDHRLEELSWTLGHPPRGTFLRVTLPLALPGIAAGAVLAFARALGEFGATVVLAGNVEGETRTIALAVYTLLESPGGRTVIWSLVGASVAMSAGALLAYESLSRRQRRRLRR